MRGDRNLHEQKQQKESISSWYVSNQRNRVDPQLSRTNLGNVLEKNKRFSADGRNTTQNYTTMRLLYCNLPAEENLQKILREEVEIE